MANEVEELALATVRATTDVDAEVGAVQGRVEQVVAVLGAIADVVAGINETQEVIGGVPTEQSAVTREILG